MAPDTGITLIFLTARSPNPTQKEGPPTATDDDPLPTKEDGSSSRIAALQDLLLFPSPGKFQQTIKEVMPSPTTRFLLVHVQLTLNFEHVTKKSTLFLVTALILTLLTAPALAQRGIHQKDFPKVPERPAVTPTVEQKQAAQAFQSTHPKWSIRWNERSRAPASVLGPPLSVPGATPRQAAEQFLIQNHTLFGMPKALSDLELVRVEQRRANHAIFQQTHAGLPIEGAVYTVHLTGTSEVYYASGTHYDSVGVDQTQPSVSQSQAVVIARQDLDSQLELREAPVHELVILPYGSEFRLAWKVVLPAKNPLGRWVYYVSASDGTILSGRNDMDTATAQGDIYDHHPERGSVVTRTLTHLDGSGMELDGNYVRVLNEDAPEAVESDGTFSYSSSNTHFDEVMVYYHATEFQKYLGNEVSYPYLNYPNNLVQVEATVHFGSNLNQAGADFPDVLVFGDGDGFTFNDTAKEDDVIAHEYQHLVTGHIANSGLDHSQGDNNVDFNETGAMDEAFSDYFGATYANSPKIGEYVWVGPGSLRNIDNSYTVSDWDGVGSDEWGPTQFHNGGQIFGGAL